MSLSEYEREVQREIDRWQRGDSSLLRQVFDIAMTPFDWLTEHMVPAAAIEQADNAVAKFFSLLSNASEWSVTPDTVIAQAKDLGLEVASVAGLRKLDLEQLDPLARAQFTQSELAAAIQGGGMGLGGVALIVADIPVLFAINLRLIQRVAAAYGFDLRGPQYRPIVMCVFNVAACGDVDSRHQALREVSVAASALSGSGGYKGRVSGTFFAQNRNIPREIAKQVIGRKLAQTIPIAGAAVGAGINYWFTRQTAQASFMVLRALHLECRERHI
ncbi:MAG: EcsC family protein [Gammaproteobacteria bacterium]|nr:EcsC family protein [Gammaproteobacteria bacterium]